LQSPGLVASASNTPPQNDNPLALDSERHVDSTLESLIAAEEEDGFGDFTSIRPNEIGQPQTTHRSPATLPPAAQFTQTLDHVPGQTAVLIGGSSESDPWLLRHCRFDEYGLKSLYGFRIRNVGGVPLTDKIPMHFIMTPDSAHDTAVADTKVKEAGTLRAELDELIPGEWGVRLIRL
jgi:hypothetical protein